jgi:DNA-binding response OmpR family regulator
MKTLIIEDDAKTAAFIAAGLRSRGLARGVVNSY